MTNKLIEDAVDEFRGWKRLLNEFHLPEERPEKEGDMAELWLKDKLTTLLTKQLTELEVEVEGKKKPLIHDVNWAEGYNASIKTVLTLIAEQKELLGNK